MKKAVTYVLSSQRWQESTYTPDMLVWYSDRDTTERTTRQTRSRQIEGVYPPLSPPRPPDPLNTFGPHKDGREVTNTPDMLVWNSDRDKKGRQTWQTRSRPIERHAFPPPSPHAHFDFSRRSLHAETHLTSSHIWLLDCVKQNTLSQRLGLEKSCPFHNTFSASGYTKKGYIKKGYSDKKGCYQKKEKNTKEGDTE